MTVLHDRLSLNAAAFYYDYKDKQVQRILNDATLTSEIDNAAKATINGFEADINALITERLTTDFGFTYLGGGYDEYTTIDPNAPTPAQVNLAGNRFPHSPGTLIFHGPAISLACYEHRALDVTR